MIIAVLILGVAVVIYSVVKNTFLAVIIGIVGEGVLAAIYFLKSTLLEGAIQKILMCFDEHHFDDFTNGILVFPTWLLSHGHRPVPVFHGAVHPEEKMELKGGDRS